MSNHINAEYAFLGLPLQVICQAGLTPMENKRKVLFPRTQQRIVTSETFRLK